MFWILDVLGHDKNKAISKFESALFPPCNSEEAKHKTLYLKTPEDSFAEQCLRFWYAYIWELGLDQYLLMNVFTISYMSNSPPFYKHHSKTATKIVTEMFVLMVSSQINFLAVTWGSRSVLTRGRREKKPPLWSFLQFFFFTTKLQLQTQNVPTKMIFVRVLMFGCNCTFLLQRKVKTTLQQVRG